MSNQVHELILCQDRLFAYLVALLGDSVTAEDILQETNLAATERLRVGNEIVDFTAWIFGVARHQVQEFRRQQGRERLRFNVELLEVLADEFPTVSTELSARHQALRSCLGDLSSNQRELILRRYGPGASVQQMAVELRRTVGVVSQTLYRIRTALLRCIQGKLAVEVSE